MRKKIEWKKGSQALLFSLYLILIGFLFSIFIAEVGNQAIAGTKAQIQADVVADAALNNAMDIYGLDPTVANFTGYVVLAMNNTNEKYPTSVIMNQSNDVTNVNTGRRMRAEDLYRYGYINVKVTVTKERVFPTNNRLSFFEGSPLADNIFDVTRESTGRVAY